MVEPDEQETGDPGARKGRNSGGDELRRRAVCRQRYGRATLTIRRWGGWGELVGDSDLARSINRYREGTASAGDVARELVRSRVVGHSPTFDWETASYPRLLRLVVACSTEPTFDDADEDAVAKRLLHEQDRMSEQIRAMGETLTASLRPILAATNRFNKSFAGNARLLSVQLSSVSKAAAQLAHPIRRDLAKWALTLPRLQPPSVRGWPATTLPSLPSSALIRQVTLNPQSFALPDLSRALHQVRRANPTVTIPIELERWARSHDMKVGEVLAAARGASDLAGELGDTSAAEMLSRATTEAESVVASPTLESVSEALGNLADLVQSNEERRQKDRQDDADTNLVLWVVAVLICIYVALWPYIARP